MYRDGSRGVPERFGNRSNRVERIRAMMARVNQASVTLPKPMMDAVRLLVKRRKDRYLNSTEFVRQAVRDLLARSQDQPHSVRP